MKKIILDCDPGHDDAIAIMLAGRSKDIDLLGITVVAGNQTLDKTVKNAIDVVSTLDLPTKVYRGSSEPLVRKQQRIADEIHGESGLEGPIFDKTDLKQESEHAVIFINNTIRESDEKITLVATGPLTNIALALKMDPSVKQNIDEIVIMGGSYQHGNISPAAEFNILADPEAASIVFNSGIPVVMVGLDVTRQVLVTSDVMDRMRKIDNKASKLFIDLMEFFNKAQKDVFGWEGGPLHDPLTIAYLLDPSVIKTKFMNVEIDTWSEQSYGRTNCDIFGLSDKEKNSYVAMEVDVEKFWDMIEVGIQSYE